MLDPKMKNYRIVIAIDRLEGGGAQRVASLLSSGWAEQGRELTLITLHRPRIDTADHLDNVRRLVIGGSGESANRLAGVFANLHRIWRLRQALKTSGAQVVLSFLTHMNVITILASRGLPIRVVVSERSDPKQQVLSPVWRLLRWSTFPMADVVTANSHNAISAMAPYARKGRLVAIPNPVEIPRIPAAMRSNSILAVGRLVGLKRHDLVITAFSEVAKEREDCHLSILGSGPNHEALTNLVSTLRLDERVSLTGHVDAPFKYYQDAAIFVIASEYEGMPNALLEAMSHGLACIVPDNLPGALEHVEDGVSGLVFRAHDVDDLVRCMRQLIGDPELRERLGHEARERMKAFSLESVLRRWDEILFPALKPIGLS